MNADNQIFYRGYSIAIDQDEMRFAARVGRDGGLVSHARAVRVAMHATNPDQIL